MFAEMLGRAAGLCRGKGGSLHITHVATGSMGANGIVAAGMPIALGLALGKARQGSDTVVVAYAGDGAIANGTSHEALNLASLWRLPIVFVREDNQYAESTPHSDYQAMPDVTPTWRAMASRAGRSTAMMSRPSPTPRGGLSSTPIGSGPTFLQCATYRWYGHNIGDAGAYRPADEVEAWRARDPIAILRRRLLDRGDATEADVQAIEADVQERIEAAIIAAEAAADPPDGWAYDDVYTTPALRRLTGADGP